MKSWFISLALLGGCWDDLESAPPSETLTIENPNMIVRAISSPDGIRCGPLANETRCSADFPQDTTVVLTITPEVTDCVLKCQLDGYDASTCALTISMYGDRTVRVSC